ncbi:MAG: hydroxyacid dehydrogenase [Candidatus Hydrogenedentes bacterium]|nr:hydroxyacid dehydrogenase [Candidatus Hydrogenedentota bacterium]
MSRPRTVVLLDRAMQQRVFAGADLDRIRAVTDLAEACDDTFTADDQLAAMRDADVIITGWGSHPITTVMLDAAPNLKLMCHSAGSIKHFINESFATRGIRVCSAAAALAVGVAEFAFGLMLMSMKAVWLYRDATRRGEFSQTGQLDWVCEPYGATVGIIGASAVGREMVRMCRSLALGAILIYDPYLSCEDAAAMGAEKTELDDLMRRSDVVSLHTPPIEACRHIVNARNFALLKDRAIFINTSRGMCVDEAALIAELQAGRLFACLDVTDPEPPAPGSPFYTLPNCVLTPHIAGAVKENTRRQGALIADEVEAYTTGRPLRHEVDLARLHLRA